MRHFLLALTAFGLVACDSGNQSLPVAQQPTAATIAVNGDIADNLAITSPDFERSRKGLVAQAMPIIKDAQGNTLWNLSQYQFLTEQEADAYVNPSLWRQAQLNNIAGLFEVAEGIYQIRGFDLANMSLIKGESGYILVDPLTSVETASAALDFAAQQIDNFSVSAIIITHSHIDHFGGVQAVTDRFGELPIYAPAGFTHESLSENVYAGIAMTRRANYMYGFALKPSREGHVDNGLGKQVPNDPTISIALPTHIISEQAQDHEIDGTAVSFYTVSGSEAPAEFVFYLPKQKAIMGAELVSHTQHNVYTLRGAKVRDARKWGDFIDSVAQRWGNEANVYFASHHWPIWGQQGIGEFLTVQRDTYRYLHDQTLRWANLGYNANEISAKVKLPQSLLAHSAARDYYGTVAHNVRAVYQFYFGWYDANPANLNIMPDKQSAAKHVAAMGGTDSVIALCADAFATDDLQWAARLCNYAVIDAPDNQTARNQLARVYTQLGYRAESGPWRDIYLSAALELRDGVVAKPINMTKTRGMLKAMPIAMFLDSLTTRIKGEDAQHTDLSLKLVLTDIGESHYLSLSNGVLMHKPVSNDHKAKVTITTEHSLLIDLLTAEAGASALLGDNFDIDGSRLHLLGFLKLLETPDGQFGLVTRHD